MVMNRPAPFSVLDPVSSSIFHMNFELAWPTSIFNIDLLLLLSLLSDSGAWAEPRQTLYPGGQNAAQKMISTFQPSMSMLHGRTLSQSGTSQSQTLGYSSRLISRLEETGWKKGPLGLRVASMSVPT
jgi:hypothetical protein